MSKSVKALVTPSVLIWARESAGYSQEDIARKLKIDVHTFKQWESGEEKPSYSKLEQLAKAYKRAVFVFYLPAPPEEEGLKKQFRTLPDALINPIPRYIRFLVRKISLRQMYLEEMGEELSVARFSDFMKSIAGLNSVDKLAGKVRDIMEVSLDSQFTLRNEEKALNFWRDKVESLGVWVFKESFTPKGKVQDEIKNKSKNYCGFAVFDKKYPVICINNSMPKSRQIFTLFHELAHIIRQKGGVDFRNPIADKLSEEYKEEEVFCNAFAGALLVPDSSVDWSSVSITDTQKLAKKYVVSEEVILRKLLNHKYITNEEYNRKIREWKTNWESNYSTKKNQGGGNYYGTEISYLGNKYLSLAFKGYYQNRYSQNQLSDYLGINKFDTLDKMEGLWLKQ